MSYLAVSASFEYLWYGCKAINNVLIFFSAGTVFRRLKSAPRWKGQVTNITYFH